MHRVGGQIERRIFEAVWVVLAGCGPAAGPQEPTGQPFAGPPPGDAAAPDVKATDPEPVTDGPKRVSALCANRRKATVDRSKATQGKPPPARMVIPEIARWDDAAGVASCTIVRDKVPATVTVLHTPHWCPQGGGSPPGPTPIQVQGHKVLVERVSIRPDGSIAKSELEWTVIGVTDEPRHNCGRRFEGLALEDKGDAPGEQLAAMAELEAASVPAFERLARELARWGAPAELVRRAEIAMRDEVRHARVMTTLARAHGQAPNAIEAPELPCRSLEAIALENAVEGCVREAYGALIATYQAEQARPELRAAFRAIAEDERRHAELAEDVHAWIVERLDAAARTEIARERTRAATQLRDQLARSRPCDDLGLPGGARAVALFDAYFAV